MEKCREMDVLEAVTAVDFAETYVDFATSVLAEAREYFDDLDNREYLPHDAEHVRNLLFVVDMLLGDVCEAHKPIYDAYDRYERSREAQT